MNNEDRFSDIDVSGEALYDTSPTGENNNNGGEDVEMQDDATVVAGSTPIEVFKTRVTLTLNLTCRNNPRAATI